MSVTELLDRPTVPIKSTNKWSFVVFAPNYAAGFNNEDEALLHQVFMNQKTGSARFRVFSSALVEAEKIDSPTFTQPQFRQENGEIIIDYSLPRVRLPFDVLKSSNGKS